MREDGARSKDWLKARGHHLCLTLQTQFSSFCLFFSLSLYLSLSLSLSLSLTMFIVGCIFVFVFSEVWSSKFVYSTPPRVFEQSI